MQFIARKRGSGAISAGMLRVDSAVVLVGEVLPCVTLRTRARHIAVVACAIDIVGQLPGAGAHPSPQRDDLRCDGGVRLLHGHGERTLPGLELGASLERFTRAPKGRRAEAPQ